MSAYFPTVIDSLCRLDTAINNIDSQPKAVEILPFTVRVAQNDSEIIKAIEIRHSAYARHMPEFAASLKEPELDDTMNDATILIAESKLDGSTLGSVRIQTNGERPLNLQQSVKLPAAFSGLPLAEFRRLAIARGSKGSLVKMILVKACLQFCEQNDIEWGIVAARPPLDRGYQQLTCVDILGGETFIPSPAIHNVPHRVMGFDVPNTKHRLTEAKHPLLDFFCSINHPDIHLSSKNAHSKDHFFGANTASLAHIETAIRM